MSQDRALILLSVVAAVCFPPFGDDATAGQDCAWSAPAAPPAFTGSYQNDIRALLAGPGDGGPLLYATGWFDEAGGVPAESIAQWDGTAWSALGGGLNSAGDAMAFFDSGSGPELYASTGGVKRWTGAQWVTFGGGVYGDVNTMTVHDDGTGHALYVGGVIYSAGGIFLDSVARWNGQVWSAVGAGLNGGVRAFAVFDDGSGPALYAGGLIFTEGDQPLFGLVKWDGENWSDVGGSLGYVQQTLPYVASLAVFNDGRGPALYVAGRFLVAGDIDVSNVARWDGELWEAVGAGLAGPNVLINALEVFDDGSGPALYAGGEFLKAAGQVANGLARWDGREWIEVGGGVGWTVNALETAATPNDNRLFVGGSLGQAGNQPVHNLVTWDGSEWSTPAGAVGGGTDFTSINALEVLDGPARPGQPAPGAYIGGGFLGVAGNISPGIAHWDGKQWSSLGDGTNGWIEDLIVHDDGSGLALYAGGAFTAAGGVPANSIARWDGASWSALGQGLHGQPECEWACDPQVSAMTVFDDGTGPSLYVVGLFTMAGETESPRVARWDGQDWHPVGAGLEGFESSTLAVFDDGEGPHLYVGGNSYWFASALLRWNGDEWEQIAEGDWGSVKSLAVFDDGSGPSLYVGGNLNFAFMDETATYLARWDGRAWSSVGGGVDGPVRAMRVLDHPLGESLYVGGYFNFAGGVPVGNIARWDGRAWSALNLGLVASPDNTVPLVHALAGAADESGATLVVGGSFLLADGLPVQNFATWTCSNPDSTFGDLDLDGAVDGADLGILLLAFGPCPEGSSCPADFNADGVVDGFDLGQLLLAWTR